MASSIRSLACIVAVIAFVLLIVAPVSVSAELEKKKDKEDKKNYDDDCWEKGDKYFPKYKKQDDGWFLAPYFPKYMKYEDGKWFAKFDRGYKFKYDDCKMKYKEKYFQMYDEWGKWNHP